MKNYIEIKNKNLKQSLIWIGITINIAFFVWFMTVGILDPAPRFQVTNYGWRVLSTITFWTTQVCAMNIIFPILVVMNGKWGVWKPGYQSWISFMAFNFMCMIIFWVGFTDFNLDAITKKEIGDISAYSNVIFSKPNKLVITLWAHLFAPTASIIVFVFFIPKYKVDIKSYYRAASPFCIAYLSSWFAINIIKMFIMYGVGVDNIVTGTIDNEYNQHFMEFFNKIREADPGFGGEMSIIGFISGPYFFFNFTLDQGAASNGMEMMMGVGFGAVIITVVMQYVVIAFANMWANKIDSNTEFNNEYKAIKEKLDGKWFEVTKIVLYIILMGISIFKLTQTQHYLDERLAWIYSYIYVAVSVVVILGSIAGIVMSLLYIFNIVTNPTWTFYLSVIIGGFGISAFFFGILLFVFSIVSLWYKSDKKQLKE